MVKHNNDPKIFIGFKGSLWFYGNIKKYYIALKKAEEKQKNSNRK